MVERFVPGSIPVRLDECFPGILCRKTVYVETRPQREFRKDMAPGDCSLYSGVIESYNTIINARDDSANESDESARRAMPADSSEEEGAVGGAVGGARRRTGHVRDRPFSRSPVRSRAVAAVAPVLRQSPADSVPATAVARSYVPLRRPAEALRPSPDDEVLLPHTGVEVAQRIGLRGLFHRQQTHRERRERHERYIRRGT